MASALRMIAVSIRTVKLGVVRPIIFEEVLVILRSLFLLVRESIVKEQMAQYKRMGSIMLLYKKSRRCGLTERVLSLRMTLLTASLNVRDVMVKTQFVIQVNTKISETADNFYRLTIDGDWAVRGEDFFPCVNNNFLCFHDVEEEMIVYTPLGKIGNRLMICIS